MDPDTAPGEEAALAEFLEMYAEDRARGSVRTVLEYQGAFEGFEDAVGRRFAALEAGGAATVLPEDVGPYRLVSELGRGGQGVVWLAEDARLGRRVALKLLQPRGEIAPETLARFRREAEIASRLDHPGICPVLDTGIGGGRAWIAMRLVPGETLARRIDSARAAGGGRPGAAAVADLVALFEKAARALHAAHEAGVVHRDVKPGNLMITPEGEPVVLDFGLARELEGGSPTLTRTGDVFGTPAYMAPEQMDPARGPVDRRADVWALGVSLHEALTLARPFEAPTREGLARAILESEPEDPRRLNPAVAADLRAVVLIAMEKDLGRRYRTALDLAEDLRRVRVREPVRARPAGPWLRLRRACQRNPFAAAGAAAAFLFLAGGLAVALVLLAAARRERDAKDHAVRRFEQMSDVVVVEDLLAQDEELWPARSDRVAAMRAWIEAARAARARLPGHRRDLEAVAALGEPDPGGDRPAFADARLRWRHDVLAGLVRGLEALGTAIPRLEARAAEADSLRARTVEAAAGDWAACAREVAADPAFAGLRLEPIEGLAPLGRDAESGLWEFWHAGSGTRPEWEGSTVAGTARLREGSGIVLVLVPGGRSWTGAQAADRGRPAFDPRARQDETPAEAALDPFLVSKWEMTQDQWERTAGANPSTFSPSRPLYGRRATLLHPVEQVDHAAARRILRRLGLDLPTEAQWERAARAGTTTAWSTGADRESLDGAANLADASFATVHRQESPTPPETWLDDGWIGHAPVGRFRPNAFGLFDVHGNVAEWCLDAYAEAPEPSRPGDGLRGAIEGPTGVARGGSWFTGADVARCAARTAPRRTNASLYLGLRPALALPK